MIRNGIKQAPFTAGLHVTLMYVTAAVLGIKDKGIPLLWHLNSTFM